MAEIDLLTKAGNNYFLLFEFWFPYHGSVRVRPILSSIKIRFLLNNSFLFASKQLVLVICIPNCTFCQTAPWILGRKINNRKSFEFFLIAAVVGVFSVQCSLLMQTGWQIEWQLNFDWLIWWANISDASSESRWKTMCRQRMSTHLVKWFAPSLRAIAWHWLIFTIICTQIGEANYIHVTRIPTDR